MKFGTGGTLTEVDLSKKKMKIQKQGKKNKEQNIQHNTLIPI